MARVCLLMTTELVHKHVNIRHSIQGFSQKMDLKCIEEDGALKKMVCIPGTLGPQLNALHETKCSTSIVMSSQVKLYMQLTQ